MKIGFANGCFDLYHAGHDHFLRMCGRQCDYLIVAVNSDRYCRRVKGAMRPIWPLEKRMHELRARAQAVIPFEGREDPLIMEIRPNVVFKGGDHAPAFQSTYNMRVPDWKNSDFPAWDTIPIIIVPRLPGYSTSAEIERRGLQKSALEHKTAPP